MILGGAAIWGQQEGTLQWALGQLLVLHHFHWNEGFPHQCRPHPPEVQQEQVLQFNVILSQISAKIRFALRTVGGQFGSPVGFLWLANELNLRLMLS